MTKPRSDGREREWQRELRAWDRGVREHLDDRRRAIMRQRILGEVQTSRSVGWLGWRQQLFAAVAASALAVVALYLLLEPRFERRARSPVLIAVAPTTSLVVAEPSRGELTGLAEVAAPELPARGEVVAQAPVPTAIGARSDAEPRVTRRTRRLALRASNGRQIHWVLDSEFALRGER